MTCIYNLYYLESEEQVIKDRKRSKVVFEPELHFTNLNEYKRDRAETEKNSRIKGKLFAVPFLLKYLDILYSILV